MKLTIKTSAKNFEIDVNENMNVGDLKQEIFRNENFPVASQKITYSSHDGDLQDEMKLSELGEFTKLDGFELSVASDEQHTPADKGARRCPQPQTANRNGSPVTFPTYRHVNLFPEKKNQGPAEILLDDGSDLTAGP